MGLEHATADGLLMGDSMTIRPSPIACDSLIAIIGNASADLPSYLHAAAVRNLGKRRWLADSACHIPFEPPLFVEDVVRTSVGSMAKDPPAAQAGYNNLFTERNYQWLLSRYHQHRALCAKSRTVNLPAFYACKDLSEVSREF